MIIHIKKGKLPLKTAPDDQVFWLYGGGTLRNLEDLRSALQTMPGEVFFWHVNGLKNDFANWVEAVMADAALAQELRKVKRQGTAFNKVDLRLKRYY
ncbi:MAG: hypothetical protein A2445_05445 [Candidatus Jacksonbacteria bacterium RIFOXYC2_FULL_44_29]|nr:MAG: hypothetical protein UW45_C0028G0005 [Parcubacteria group bacterium GW2011_GWC2_44_22]OGY74706.1 MAG: hypothetical protein A2240_04945 [Candidatus Jacksonbacteria bacterium RIFOXYA2_FULL_43_12]OGY77217.1 MAG: hypothetical protein A2295_03595 [Candidatus Jacksonbacteria bacterium RIFOXYB2_FULL_44_15]OGY79154.1 MAG: hypothetical protein A2550_01265 [Candidatus Jacksonbacteria bacterium RIFOXYD2_FULL_43_21]OGY80134.1 MAG: hypothetical protein A2445_05445 [Candidatus Jacksonbacteria bacteri